MTDWDPRLYKRFEEERTRPAGDLLSRVGLQSARHVVDLGCGPGNSTELLAKRFPDADLSGIDSSEAMLVEARARLPKVRFAKRDIARWSAERPVDLLFANAVLQWLPGHAALLPRLFGMLAPGGVLAVQMPDNLDEPSHRAMRGVSMDRRWRDRLDKARGAHADAVLTPGDYFDLLGPLAADTDVWRTAYHHPMPSPRSIVDWLRSTGLRPFLNALEEPDQTAFLRLYEAAVADAYPVRADGQRLLAFPRTFIVARRAA